jgi:hypothetical protein
MKKYFSLNIPPLAFWRLVGLAGAQGAEVQPPYDGARPAHARVGRPGQFGGLSMTLLFELHPAPTTGFATGS